MTAEPRGEQPPIPELPGSAHPDQRYLAIERLQIDAVAGPLPSPALLGQYEQVLPGLADRIVRMAEVEQRHQHLIEQGEVRMPYVLARRGQLCALVVAVLVLALAAVMALTGSPVPGAIVAGLDITAVVTAFLYGQRRRTEESTDQAGPD